jgi:hypothetical protein
VNGSQLTVTGSQVGHSAVTSGATMQYLEPICGW